MIAANNEYLKKTSNTLYNLNADFEVREHARNREKYCRTLDTRDSKIKKQNIKINHFPVVSVADCFSMGYNLQLYQKDNNICQLIRILSLLCTAICFSKCKFILNIINPNYILNTLPKPMQIEKIPIK